MAVEVGFEPTHALHVYLLSRQSPLTSWVLYHVNLGMKKGHLIRCPFPKTVCKKVYIVVSISLLGATYNLSTLSL